MNIQESLSRVALIAVIFGLTACSEPKAPPHVSIVQPADGATVGQRFKVVMAVEGMKVRKAGEIVNGTGHFDLIVDGSAAPMGEVIFKDHQHLHYKDGQSEATLHLYPGKHSLTLQFANGLEKSYGQSLSHTISVTVK
ncbi:DUF4399 domain-containing protein [Mariprofundus ferrooxydans]|uniref:DUF4399 domain-containing protein n=1 Tax=Mariprofundus ferrooxydans PV-1 TaxID=314345 RepID=Q0EYV0_9PROT|nr:DUF4399 domain-containing protein [Mariprofundus ferrooxydans]EAU54457.1 hypothetical protein SPV1_08566 [Mariprofundus ferrooxydans PV-1]KON48382.1 rod shape-determining protein RodA [Mariprofundus ferrooxydans]